HLDQCHVVIPAHIRLRFEAADVGIFIREHAGELMQKAGPVVGVNHDANGERIARVARPVDFNLALGVVHEILHVRARPRVNRYPLAAGDIADDTFALDRVTALRPIDHDVVHAVDFNNGIVVLLSVALRGRWLDHRRRRGLFGHLLGRGFLQYLTGGKFAVAEARIQVLDLAQAVFAGYTLQIVLLNPVELHTQTARFFFEILLANLDRPLALILVDDVLDLVLRAGSLDDRQPVLAGLVAGLGE